MRSLHRDRKLFEMEALGFLRGLVAFVGFPQRCVQYDRDERFSGRGNYNRLLGSLRIGLNGLVSFSSRPLFLMSVAGVAVASGTSPRAYFISYSSAPCGAAIRAASRAPSARG